MAAGLDQTPDDRKSGDGHSVPEPVPDWSKPGAQVTWNWALPIHSYTFGVIFLMVAIYAIVLLFKLRKTRMQKSRNYFQCITALICSFGLTRATVLIADPYTSSRPLRFPPSLGLILFSLGYPCLSSGFFLINWSLIEVTKLQLLPARIHQRKVLVPVLLVHFLVVIIFDVSFTFCPETHMLLFVCRCFFVLWGILLFGGFILGGLRVQRQVARNLRTLTVISSTPRGTMTSAESAGTRTPLEDLNNKSSQMANTNQMANLNLNRIRQARTEKVMKIARRAAATGLLICCTQIYTLYEFYVFYNYDMKPQPWPWWAYQTCFRLVELFMVSQMFRIVRPPK